METQVAVGQHKVQHPPIGQRLIEDGGLPEGQIGGSLRAANGPWPGFAHPL